MDNRCRLCGNDTMFSIMDLGDMPIAHRMLASADAAEDVFAFHVIQCPTCGLSQIERPVSPDILYAGFNFNFSSWKNEPHIVQEIDWLFRDRTFQSALDIGCNDGRFLAALKERGIDTCVGIEPNSVPAAKAAERGVSVINKMLDDETAREIVDTYGAFNLVTSRQVLEHTLDPVAFLSAARTMLKDGGLLFLDMPDFEPTLQQADVSTLWEEHPSYFTEPTLRKLLAKTGFECTGVQRYDFSGGCLAVTAIKTNKPVEAALDVSKINRQAKFFDAAAREYGHKLFELLKRRRNNGATVVLYGVGVRGCTAVNGYRLGKVIDFALDDQKERQGLYLPGARLEIKPVDTLCDISGQIIVLLAVNNENEDKVSQRLNELLGERVITLSLCGPRDFKHDLQLIETEVEA